MADKHKILAKLEKSWQRWRSHPYLWSLLVLIIVHLPSTTAAWLTIANLWLPQIPSVCPTEIIKKPKAF